MAETNTAALRAQGERDARALTVTGRRRADTGRIRRAMPWPLCGTRACAHPAGRPRWAHAARGCCARAGGR